MTASSAVALPWMPRPLQSVTPAGTCGSHTSNPADISCTTRTAGSAANTSSGAAM